MNILIQFQKWIVAETYSKWCTEITCFILVAWEQGKAPDYTDII